ncbi:MAG: YggT family protein [Candidatus Delongbacteria bacterium]|nr:YggT family protein [Candidatus Delongbacteria bacterium]
MIVLFFDILSLFIIVRVIFSLIGYNYGGIYDFVYLWSEKILKPIRKKLPPTSRIDWSPLIALLIFDLGKKILPPLIEYIVNGRYDLILPLFFYVFISVLSSLTVFFLILFAVRIINDALKGDNYAFTAFINSVTDPIAKKVKQYIPFGYKRHSVWITLGILILLKLILSRIMGRY